MSKPKSERFKLLQKIADKYENLAAQDLSVSVGNLQMQRSRLAELKRFREEYTRQFYETGAVGISGAAMQSFQRFIGQIDLAIKQQTQTVALAEHDHVDKKSAWEGKHRKTRIYEKTRIRFEQSEQQNQQCREQNELDDRNNSRQRDKDFTY